MSAWKISMWACIAGWMEKKQRDVFLSRTDSELIDVLNKWREEKATMQGTVEGPFPPGLKAVGQMLS